VTAAGAATWRGADGYEAARLEPQFNARRPDRYPEGIVFAESADDVVAAVPTSPTRRWSC
jgi:hypothetical protein